MDKQIDIKNDIVNNVAEVLGLQNYKFVIGERFGKGDNYLGSIHRATIAGFNRNNNKEETHKLIIKVSLRNSSVRKHLSINLLYAREIFVYKTFLPAIDEFQNDCNVPISHQFKFSKCYATDDEDNSELLIFGDLNEKDFVMFDRLKPVDYEHAMLVMKYIAKFHAASFALKDRKPEIYEEAEKYKFHLEDFGKQFEEHLFKCKDDAVKNIENNEHKERFKKFGENIYKEMFDSLDIDNDDCPYNVLCHGDCWNNNFLYRYEDSKPVEVIMVDWQILRYASPISDLSYFIYSGTDKEFRDKYLNELYDTYYTTLKSHLNKLDVDIDKCYPEYVFRQQIKSKSVFGLIWSFLILPIALSRREDAKDLNDFIESKENGDEQEEDGVKYSQDAKIRFNEVVSDFVEMGVL